MQDKDYLQRFLFDKAPIRGEVIHLDQTWHEVLSRHTYPKPIQDILGECLSAALLLSATIKVEGSLTMQIQGDGPINLLVVEVTTRQVSESEQELERVVRGVAHWQSVPDSSQLAEIFGQGQMVMTIDPQGAKERYQGIVPLEGDSVAHALENYLLRSEQLATRIWLASGEDTCGGLLIQRLPDEDALSDPDAWERAVKLADTISAEELLSLSAETLLHRLYHEEDIRLFTQEHLSFFCSCSRDRVANMLRSLGRDELLDILKEQEKVSVDCEFCGQHYGFDSVDIEQLCVSDISIEAPSTRQ